MVGVNELAGKIMVVDDEAAVVELVAYNLKAAGFDVLKAYDGAEALAMVRRELPALIVLDLMLPGMDGLTLCRELRKETDVPILILTARKEVADRVVALELGADDYLAKPFSPRELVARVKAILRRTLTAGTRPARLVRGPIVMDLGARRVKVGERELELSFRQFELLRLFLENPGQVLTRDLILEKIWGLDFEGDYRTIDVHIFNLRSKLKEVLSQDCIETVRGVGYRFALAEKTANGSTLFSSCK